MVSLANLSRVGVLSGLVLDCSALKFNCWNTLSCGVDELNVVAVQVESSVLLVSLFLFVFSNYGVRLSIFVLASVPQPMEIGNLLLYSHNLQPCAFSW